MPTLLGRSALATALASCGIAAAQAAGDLNFTTPQAAIAVERGGSTAMPIHVENTAAEASDATTVMVARLREGWTFALAGTGCGALHDTSEADVRAFDIPSLPPGGTLDCELTLTRSPAGIDDLHVQVWSAIGFRVTIDAIAGTFADIALDSELVSSSVDPSGVSHGVFRLTATNVGNVPVGAFDAMTCSHARTFNNAIAGGCAPTTSTCAREFVPTPAQGARLPALAPGEQASCLLEVPLPSPIPFADDALTIDQDPPWDVWLIDTATAGRVYDANAANNTARFDAPVGGVAPISAPAVSPPALALLGAGLVWIAAWVSRRRGLRRP
ncbi:hypothetical protein [Dokdonella sp.]|uniref:hypothetical protein n=1 Tax=Dokdonella sp. TaxID=2291710 RepID=UPI002F424429